VAEKIALGVLPELRFVLVPLSDRCASYARATVADLNHRSGRRFWTCRALDELAFVDVLRTPIFDVETRAAILDEDGNALHQYDRPLSALWRPATTRICRAPRSRRGRFAIARPHPHLYSRTSNNLMEVRR
jgi:hypothetical protein